MNNIEQIDESFEKKDESIDKGKEFVENLIARAEEAKKEWDGKKIYKILKFLIIFSVVIVFFIEMFFFLWPKVKHNFPETIPIEEKCKKAECPKYCNGECSCKYINVYEREEEVSCIIN